MALSGRGHGAGPVLITRCGGTAVGDVDELAVDDEPPPHPATSAPVNTTSATARRR